MMRDRSDSQVPMRIEMATSEIEGAGILAWADPEQVIACVARSKPLETFDRFLAPRLVDLGHSGPSQVSGRPSGPPERVSILIDRLRQAHTRLYRENAAGGTRRLLWPVVALVEENTVYFVKGARCWIFLLREGLASPLWVSGETVAAAAGPTGLGESEKLSLAVSSIEVTPLDILVVLACETNESPDRRAVTRVFDEIRDLKRACDGLVNLFGNEPGGAAAIAMRFVPIGTGAEVTVHESAFDDLVEDLRSVHGDRPTAEAPNRATIEELRATLASALRAAEAPPVVPTEFASTAPAVPVDEPQPALPAWMEEDLAPAGVPAAPSSIPASARPASFPEVAAPRTPVSAQAPVAATVSVAPQAPATAQMAAASPATAPPPPVPPSKRGRPPRGNPWGHRWWMFAVGGALVAVTAVLGVPRGLKMVRAGGSSGNGGVIRVESTPQAVAISIDGVDQGTGTPAILDGIRPGTHELRLDLGPFGTIEKRVRVGAGETVDIAPRATGMIEISAVAARPGAETWIAGGKHYAVPCRLDTLPVGWKELFYADDRLPLWQRQVPVRAGETTRIRVNNDFDLDRALLTVESWTFTAGKGLRETPDDTVYVDGRMMGFTPFEKEMTPGLHGVRVRGGEGRTWTEVVEMSAGSSRVVAPRFGVGRWPRIAHQEPGRVVLSGALLLTVRIATPDGESARNPRLHLPTLDASVRDIPLSPVDMEEGSYIGMVDPRWIPRETPVSYYFTVQTASGETVTSDLYRLTVVRDIS